MADLEPTPISASLLRRAKALTPRHIWWPRMQWAAAAAALLFASFLGYRVGNTTRQGHRDTQILGSLQLDELISEPAFGIIMPVNGHNGR